MLKEVVFSRIAVINHYSQGFIGQLHMHLVNILALNCTKSMLFRILLVPGIDARAETLGKRW